MKITSGVLTALLLFGAIARAETDVSVSSRGQGAIGAPRSQLALQEQVTVTVSVNGSTKTLLDAKALFDKRRTEVEAAAKAVAVQPFELTSFSYNISPQTYQEGSGSFTAILAYQLNGSLSYKVSTSEAAIKVIDRLATLQIPASLSVSGYQSSAPLLE